MRLWKLVWRYRVLWLLAAIVLGATLHLPLLIFLGVIGLFFHVVTFFIEEWTTWYEKLEMWHHNVAKIRQEIKRTSPPKCAVCGQDLSAAEERCPECGTDVPFAPIPKTPTVLRIFEHADALARDWNDDYVGSEHVLLALFREPDGTAAQMLQKLGASEERVRALLEGSAESPEEAAPSPT